jgi:glycosyltransferase involved in cell wall biosynthesis
MRILIAGITYYPAPNGQARATVNLAEGMARRGHEVMVVLPSIRKTDYVEDRNGVHIRGIKSINLSTLHPDAYFSLFSNRVIRDLVDQFQPDIVHIQDHYPLTRSVAIAAKRRGIKVVGSNHFMPENLAPYLPGYSLMKKFYDWFLWRWMLDTFNPLDAVIVPSKTAAELLTAQRVHPPVFVISGGIHLDRFYPIPGIDRKVYRERYGLDVDRIIFLFVGRIDEEKRLDVILRALSTLHRDDIQFCITGHGAAQGKLMKMAHRLNLGRQVLFTGFVPNEDLPYLINSCDIFVMPSEAELLSIATLEAMACGRAILAAQAIALPELVSDGLNGYLFRPGDAMDAAHCMVKLADHPELWAGMATLSIERAQPHSMEVVLQRNEALYEMVISGSVVAEMKKTPFLVGKKRPKGKNSISSI